ncbi:hypothetical protein FB639_006157, partial [Coemansia asiatica]
HKDESERLRNEVEALKLEIGNQQIKAKILDDELTPQRVSDIVKAAVSQRLVPVVSENQAPSPKPAQQQQQQQQQGQGQGQGGGKGKGKKKRKGTVSSSGAPSKPASPAPLSVPALETSFTQQEEADVAVSKTEIDRLVALIEAIPLPSETPTASASEPSNKPSDEDELILELQKTIDELQAQLSEQQKSAESAQIANKEQTAGLQQRIAQLEQELKDAAGARDQLQNELSEKTEQLITAANELDHAKSLAETVPELNKRIQQMQVTMTELQRELGENRDRLGKVQSELTAAQDDHAFLKQKLNDAEKER